MQMSSDISRMGTCVICRLHRSNAVTGDCNSAGKDKFYLSCKQLRFISLNLYEFHVMNTLLSRKYRSGVLILQEEFATRSLLPSTQNLS